MMETTFNLREELDDGEDRNCIQFQTSSNIIKLPFYQFLKYSRISQENQIKEIINQVTTELKSYQKSSNIQEESVKIFFKFLNDENGSITPNNYIDLCKLSDKFKIHALQAILRKYAESNMNNIELLLNLLNDLSTTENNEVFNFDIFSTNIETCLAKEINSCLKNKKFENLEISTVYRIIGKSAYQKIQSDLLLDFILKSIKDRHILFHYLSIQNLSDEKFNVLFQIYSNLNESDEKIYFQCLTFDLFYIKNLKDENKKYESIIKSKEDDSKQLKNQLSLLNDQYNKKISNLEDENKKLKDQLSEQNLEYKSRVKSLEDDNKQLKNQVDQLNILEDQHNKKISDLEDENKKLKNQINQQNNELKTKGISFPIIGNNEYKGIINYLKSHNNIENEITFTYSSNDHETPSQYYGNILNITLFDDKDKGFFTKDIPNSWICLEFRNHKIIPTGYTIMTCNSNPFLRSWIIEGCNDNNSWEEIDSQNNRSDFNGYNCSCTYHINKKNLKEIKFIRIRQIQSSNKYNYLGICAFEIYGSLI